MQKRMRILGLKRAGLANLLGEDANKVDRWYRGKVSPRLDEARAIAGALGLSLAYLVDDTQDEPPPPPPDVTAAPPTRVPVVPPAPPVDEACILRIAHELGLDEALRRLLAPGSGPGAD